MQILFQFETNSFCEEIRARRLVNTGRDPSNESKNSVRLQNLNCETLDY